MPLEVDETAEKETMLWGVGYRSSPLRTYPWGGYSFQFTSNFTLKLELLTLTGILHVASLSKRDLGELGNDLLILSPSKAIALFPYGIPIITSSLRAISGWYQFFLPKFHCSAMLVWHGDTAVIFVPFNIGSGGKFFYLTFSPGNWIRLRYAKLFFLFF